MMNKKIALDPTLCRNYSDLKYLLEKFGLDQGRFLVNYPSSWINQIRTHITIFPDYERKKAFDLITKLNNDGLLPAGEPFNPGCSWVRNAIQLKQQGKIFAAIANSPPEALTLDEVDEEKLGDSRSERINAIAYEYVRIATPLLRLSTEVLFIDPYLNLSWNYLEVLQAFIKATNNREFYFIFFSRDENLNNDAEKIAREKLLPHMTEKQSIRFVSLDDKQEMHARYLLSIKGGIKFDKGFRQDKGTLVDVEVMSKTILKEYVRLYLENEHDYKVKRDFTITACNTRN